MRSMSRKEFENLPRRCSRWDRLFRKLERDNEPHPVALPKNTAVRRTIACQIRALARRREISIRMRTVHDTLFVQRLETE